MGRTQATLQAISTPSHYSAHWPRRLAFFTCSCATSLASLLCTNPKSMRNWRKLELRATRQQGRVCFRVGSYLF